MRVAHKRRHRDGRSAQFTQTETESTQVAQELRRHNDETARLTHKTEENAKA